MGKVKTHETRGAILKFFKGKSWDAYPDTDKWTMSVPVYRFTAKADGKEGSFRAAYLDCNWMVLDDENRETTFDTTFAGGRVATRPVTVDVWKKTMMAGGWLACGCVPGVETGPLAELPHPSDEMAGLREIVKIERVGTIDLVCDDEGWVRK